MSACLYYKQYFLCLLLLWLPGLLPAQEAQPDSSLQQTTLGGTAGSDALADDEDAETVTEEVQPHSFWDRALPLSLDSLDADDGEATLVLRQPPDKVIQELKADKKLQYDRPRRPRSAPLLQQFIFWLVRALTVLRPLLIVLLVAALLWLVYFILKRQGFRFSRKRAAEDEVPADAAAEPALVDYEKQVQEAIAAGKLRLAVRLLYLQTLRLLADREVISYSRDKTNAEYLRGMAQTRWYKDFAGLTLNYEYIWYGEMPVNSEQFGAIQRQFHQFMNEFGYTR